MRKKKQPKAAHVEVKDMFADHDYWTQLEKYLPWTLSGFTARIKAVYTTNCGNLTLMNGQVIELLEAFEKLTKPEDKV